MTAGEQARVGAELLEQQQRVLDGRRAFVAERCWDLQDCLLVSLRRHTFGCYGRGVNIDLRDRLGHPLSLDRKT